MADLQTTYISDLTQGPIQDSTLFIIDDGTNTNSATAADVANFAKDKILPEANSYADTKKNEAVEKSKEYTNGVISNPNLLINGPLDVWQRGDNFTIAKSQTCTADMWICRYTNCTIQKVSTGLPLFPNGLQYINNGDTSNYNVVYQPLANYEKYTGETLTFSFFVKGTVGRTLNCYIGNSRVGTVTLTDTFTRYSFTQKNVIFGDNFYKGVAFNTAGLGFNTGEGFTITDCKLEVGNVATANIPEDTAIELLKCYANTYILKRTSGYYQYGAGFAIANNKAMIFLKLPIPMRQMPTVTFTSDYSNVYFFDTSAKKTINNVATDIYNGTTQAILVTSSAANLTIGSGVALNANGDGFEIVLDAMDYS